MNAPYHRSPTVAQFSKQTLGRALASFVAAACLTGCAVSMPIPGFIDESQTGSVVAKSRPAPKKTDPRLPPKPDLAFALDAPAE